MFQWYYDRDHGMSYYQTKQNLWCHTQKRFDQIKRLDHDQIINLIDDFDQFVKVTNIGSANSKQEGPNYNYCNPIWWDQVRNQVLNN